MLTRLIRRAGRLPQGLPVLGMLLGGLGMLSYGMSFMITLSIFGRPSSTAVIGFPIVAIYSVVWAAGGLAVGGILWAAARVAGTALREPVWYARAVRVLIGSIVTIGVLWGASRVADEEWQARPRVIITTTEVVRVPNATLPDENERREAVVVYADFPSTSTITAEDLPKCDLSSDGMTLATGAVKSEPLVPVGLTWWGTLRAVKLMRGDDVAGYALASDGRATGGRSGVFVFSPDLRLLHNELLKRPGRVARLYAVPPRQDGDAESVVLEVEKGEVIEYRLAKPPRM